MEHTLAKAAIEAILFAMGESVEVSRLADAIGEDVKTTREILGEMEQEYRQEGRGIGMTWFDSAVQLCDIPKSSIPPMRKHFPIGLK